MRRSLGFSLVELVAVMVLLGIMTVYAVAKISSSSGQEYVLCREAVTRLQETQAINMSQGKEPDIFFFIKKDGSFGYCQGAGCENKTELQHGIGGQSGILSNTAGIVQFDYLGRVNKDKTTLSLSGKDNKYSFSFYVEDASDGCYVDVYPEGGITWR